MHFEYLEGLNRLDWGSSQSVKFDRRFALQAQLLPAEMFTV